MPGLIKPMVEAMYHFSKCLFRLIFGKSRKETLNLKKVLTSESYPAFFRFRGNFEPCRYSRVFNFAKFLNFAALVGIGMYWVINNILYFLLV